MNRKHRGLARKVGQVEGSNYRPCTVRSHETQLWLTRPAQAQPLPVRHTPGPEPAPHGPHHLLPPKRLALLVRARDQVQEVDEEEGGMAEEGGRSVSAACAA
jgi:hypothetical protein